MALMYLYVPNEYAEQATDLLESIPQAPLDDALLEDSLDSENISTQKGDDQSKQTDLESE